MSMDYWGVVMYGIEETEIPFKEGLAEDYYGGLEYIFDTVYKEAERGNFDLVGFSAVEGKTYNPSHLGRIGTIRDLYKKRTC